MARVGNGAGSSPATVNSGFWLWFVESSAVCGLGVEEAHLLNKKWTAQVEAARMGGFLYWMI